MRLFSSSFCVALFTANALHAKLATRVKCLPRECQTDFEIKILLCTFRVARRQTWHESLGRIGAM